MKFNRKETQNKKSAQCGGSEWNERGVQSVRSLRGKWCVNADLRTRYMLCSLLPGGNNETSITAASGVNCLRLLFCVKGPINYQTQGRFLGWGNKCFSPTFRCASIFFCDGYCCLTNGNKLHGAGAWIVRSWGVSNSVLKDDEARASGFCGRLRPDWSRHKVLVEEREKGRTGFRQAAVKLGELTMAALFL